MSREGGPPSLSVTNPFMWSSQSRKSSSAGAFGLSASRARLIRVLFSFRFSGTMPRSIDLDNIEACRPEMCHLKPIKINLSI